MAGKYFPERVPDDSAYTLPKISSKSVYLRPFPKINAFLRFTQKFKMATKNGGKTIADKKFQMTVYTPGAKILLRSLYCVLLLRQYVFVFYAET